MLFILVDATTRTAPRKNASLRLILRSAPKERVSKDGAAMVRDAALADAAVRKSLGDLGVDIVGNTPEEFTAYIKAEIPKWTAIVKASGATLD